MTLKYAWRSLAKSKAFVAIAVVALGVGLGLSTTMFAVMDAVLHPWQPYHDPETLFGIRWWTGRRNPMGAAELYRYIRDNTSSFAAVVPIGGNQVTLRVDGEEEEHWAQRVSARFFAVTGARVARGRVFTASDGGDVAIVSNEMWRRLFGKRRFAAGVTLHTTDRTYAIVGVLPEGADRGYAHLWIPIDSTVETSARDGASPLVRLKPAVTKEQADDELKRLARLLTDRFGAQGEPFAFELSPRVRQREDIKDIQKAMIGAALLVLLIACVNLAHLMLARGIAKKKELALRMALGASRAVVVRQTRPMRRPDGPLARGRAVLVVGTVAGRVVLAGALTFVVVTATVLAVLAGVHALVVEGIAGPGVVLVLGDDREQQGERLGVEHVAEQ